MKRCFVMAAAAGAMMLSTQARAAFLDVPLPSNTYITFDNLEWAWAYPFPASCPGFDLSYQSQFGWQLPTEAELASAALRTERECLALTLSRRCARARYISAA
jgi:hypothetical protein